MDSKRRDIKMKRILYVFALLAVLLVVSTPAHATRATTTNRCIACMSEQLLDDMTQYIAAKDKYSVGAYLQDRRGFLLKTGLDVTVIKINGILGGKVEAVYKGVKFWTYQEGLTDYRTTP